MDMHAWRSHVNTWTSNSEYANTVADFMSWFEPNGVLEGYDPQNLLSGISSYKELLKQLHFSGRDLLQMSLTCTFAHQIYVDWTNGIGYLELGDAQMNFLISIWH